MTNVDKMLAGNSRDTLLHCLFYWAKRQPNEIYLTQPYPDGRVEEISWQQSADQVLRMAQHLQTLGLPPRSHIGLLGKNSAHWILSDLAIWAAGHVSVPLYFTLNADTAAYIFDHAEVKLLILGKLDGKTDTWGELQHIIPPSLPVINLPMSPRASASSAGADWSNIVGHTLPTSTPYCPQRDELATIVYTSGSTGRPKGVMHSFGTMTVVGESTISATRPSSPQDRMLSYLPLAHVAERAAVESSSLYAGFHVYFSVGLETFQQDLKRARPTIFFSVPRLWTRFYLAIHEKLPASKQRILFALPFVGQRVKKKILSELGLDQVDMAITGSAPLPPHILDWYRMVGLDLIEGYGMSENFAISHITKQGEYRLGYVGSPAPGVECRLGPDGEVLVKSPGQMMGYYKAPELTAAEMTPDGFFKTGDRGEIDEQGRLKLTGRTKELFKTSKGKYVAPAPIENKLSNHAKVWAVCVTGPGQTQPLGLMMLSPEAEPEIRTNPTERQRMELELKSLLADVNSGLDDHEQLAYLVVVKDQWTMDNGYLTPTMKIKRNVIEDRYLGQTEKWSAAGQALIWE